MGDNLSTNLSLCLISFLQRGFSGIGSQATLLRFCDFCFPSVLPYLGRRIRVFFLAEKVRSRVAATLMELATAMQRSHPLEHLITLERLIHWSQCKLLPASASASPAGLNRICASFTTSFNNSRIQLQRHHWCPHECNSNKNHGINSKTGSDSNGAMVSPHLLKDLRLLHHVLKKPASNQSSSMEAAEWFTTQQRMKKVVLSIKMFTVHHSSRTWIRDRCCTLQLLRSPGGGRSQLPQGLRRFQLLMSRKLVVTVSSST